MENPHVPDPVITQRITNKLSARGMRHPCKIAIQTTNGMVTLTGCVQSAEQKGTAARVAHGILGVRHVIDQLKVLPSKR